MMPRSEQRPPTALIIDVDPIRRASLGRWVGQVGFAARAAETPEKANAELDEQNFDLALADRNMLDSRGIHLFDDLAEGPLPVTGACSDAAWTARDEGDRRPPPLARFGRLIGKSPPMQRIYDQLLRVAPTSASVFLVGESGTGKELAAELIHGLSPRATRPFVTVNCGALSPSLIEAELFGHERGSFTGADRRHIGLFERAQGGTLFLDEITEMPLDLQVKLLRVLESRKVRRVGGDGPIDVDVRVIAATNRDPHEALEQKALREDLFYRLLVFPVELPPLRDRADDATLIARNHLHDLNQENATRKELTDDALEHLQAHSWPGNVRELRNALERAFILAERAIDLRHFSADPFSSDLLAGSHDGEQELGVRVGMPIAEAEKRLIVATLEELQGDKKKAAKTLGISVKTLYSRLSVYRAEDRRN